MKNILIPILGRKKNGQLIIRWDNAPHHKQIQTYPHHKHLGESHYERYTEHSRNTGRYYGRY